MNEELDEKYGYPKEEEGDSYSKMMDPDYVDEFGNDIFDRIGMTIFGGPGIVTSIYNNALRPVLKKSTRVIKKYNLGGYLRYLLFILTLFLCNELFMVRRLHLRCCPCLRKRNSNAQNRKRGTDNMRDVAR